MQINATFNASDCMKSANNCKEEKKMNHKENMCSGLCIYAPMNGETVALESVPDPVFSDKALGDGIAILPTDGKIYSPVDGILTVVAETKHAFGYQTKDGVDILVHVGLETVSLKGEGFKVYVKEGDSVKKGDLVGEVDLKFLREKNINSVTMILICGGADGLEMNKQAGKTKAGKTEILRLSDKCEMPKTEKANTLPQKTESIVTKEKKGINFDFLQKLGKVLMAVIAVMPAAGLMISLGKLVQMAGADMSLVLTIGSVMEQIGWAIITNLHILFAVAIGGSWAKERAGGAFAAVIAFVLINVITGSIFGVTADMLNDAGTEYLQTKEGFVFKVVEVQGNAVGVEYTKDYYQLTVKVTTDTDGKLVPTGTKTEYYQWKAQTNAYV